jgi:predicted acyl esterase
LAIAPSALGAVTPITSNFNGCPYYGDVRICSGQVPSFDGSKLDVDLTLPANSGSSKRPLIVMMHGFGNNKHEWQSSTDEGDGQDKWHWNSHWFAKHGYYVLTYTARGFRDDGRTRPDQPNTPSFTSVDLPSGTIHLKSREFEIRDTQWLAALVADAYADIDPKQIAVTGGSYGGGESWLQASQAVWDFPNARDSSLPVLELQVAVPKYPWTDTAYSLAPNGHGGGPSGTDIYESSQGQADSPSGQGNPIGVVKLSFVTGLFALGNTQGVFEEGTTTTPSDEGPINIPAWVDRGLVVGEPYDLAGIEDPLVTQIRRGLTEFRGSYYQDRQWQAQVGRREVAIFSISGWTDDLLGTVESFRQYKYLKRLDPKWPVALWVGDVGHSRAQNQPEDWHRANNQAWQFLQAQIGGSHQQSTTVTTEPTICENDAVRGNNDGAAVELTASTPERLSAGRITVNYARGDTLTSTGRGVDPNGVATDPVIPGVLNIPVGQPCRTSPGPSPDYTATSLPLTDASTHVGLGYVRVPYTFYGTTGHLDARVWDVTPSGNTLLITRGTYRIDVPRYDGPSGVLKLPLFGNSYRLPVGHRIRLDLTQNDTPFLRTSNVPSSITFGPPSLVLPTRESASRVIAGS